MYLILIHLKGKFISIYSDKKLNSSVYGERLIDILVLFIHDMLH